jgi:hypothetical protein
MNRASSWLLVLTVLGLGSWGVGVVLAQDMPDPALMHGRAIPAPELPDGAVTVRVVRENIGNNVAGQEVQVTDASATRSETTDDLGRAEFRNLTPGSTARAQTTVDGETLESQPFTVPGTGGLRVILVAGLAQAAERRKQEEAAAAAAPPVKGTVVIAGNSAIVLQLNDDQLEVFYMLEVVNSARNRVDIGGPLVIELPRRAVSSRLLEGSSPATQVNGRRVTVVGPFASGSTPVRVGFSLPYSSPDLVVEQPLPIPLQQATVAAEKKGAISLSSPQLADVSDRRAQDGTAFTAGTATGLQPGTPLQFTLSHLPVRSQTPRYVALTLAIGLAVLGVWLAATARSSRPTEVQGLRRRRDELLAEVAQLEAGHRAGKIGADRYLSRRQRMLRELEQIYGELDEAGAAAPTGGRRDGDGPRGGGEGIAA